MGVTKSEHSSVSNEYGQVAGVAPVFFEGQEIMSVRVGEPEPLDTTLLIEDGDEPGKLNQIVVKTVDYVELKDAQVHPDDEKYAAMAESTTIKK